MARPEHPPEAELDDALLLKYMLTFISRTDCYPRQADDGSYFLVKRPVHNGVIAAHLRGHMTIGAYALSSEHTAKWLVLDADEPQEWQHLLTLADTLEQEGVSAYRELSRRGGHLWLFTPPTSGEDIRRFAKQLLTEHHIPEKKPNLPGIEIYPKQDRLVTGPGSLVRLPLGIHRVTGRRYSFITAKGTPLAPTVREQLRLLTAPSKVPSAFIETVLSRIPPPEQLPTPRPRSKKRIKTRKGEPVSERIKSAVTVAEFISQYVELDDRGKGFCPFHDDQHKSFQISISGNFWHCHAGCSGQTIIDFWMLWRKKQGEDDSFKATIKDLANRLLE